MKRAYGTLLRFYPYDFRAAFGVEMMEALAGVEGRRRVGELAGLLTGMAAEWVAKFSTDPAVRGRALPDLRMMRPAHAAGDMVRRGRMLAGHLAVGLAAKRIAPRLSLGTTVLASVLPDLLWGLFLLAGVEHVKLGTGRGAVNYLAVSDIAFSHSLAMDILWAGLLALGYFLLRHYPRGAWILFAAVISHWLLDYISHGPDMALAPGVDRYFGLGLWYSVGATLLVEGGMWAVAVIAYTRATRARNGWGVYAFWIAIVLLTLVWYGNITGAAPPDARTMARSSLIFFSLVVAWAYWMNRLRPACYNSV